MGAGISIRLLLYYPIPTSAIKVMRKYFIIDQKISFYLICMEKFPVDKKRKAVKKSLYDFHTLALF